MTRIAPKWLSDPATRRVRRALAPLRPLFVGGCVRDALLGEEAADIDLCVAARPEASIALLNEAGLKAVPTGLDHGVVTAVVDGRPFEVASLRRDMATDGRRAVVAFTDRIAEDAARRDFTVNALYADGAGALRDPLGAGLEDLNARRVRFIGDPALRIAEDHLRILRFFRFSARFADGFDARGVAACRAGAAGIERLSRERVGMEMRRILGLPDAARAVTAMARAGVLARALPGATPALLDRLQAAEAAARVAPDWPRRLAALEAAQTTQALRLSRAEAARQARIARARAAPTPPAQAAQLHGADAARDAALIAAAARHAAPQADLEAELARGAAQIFPLRAGDLIAAGATPGPALGAALERLKARWIAEDFAPDRAALLKSLSSTQ